MYFDGLKRQQAEDEEEMVANLAGEVIIQSLTTNLDQPPVVWKPRLPSNIKTIKRLLRCSLTDICLTVPPILFS